MKAQHIPFEKTGQFSKLFLEYIHGDKGLAPFYKYTPSPDSFKEALKAVSSHTFNRKLLVDVINEQYTTSQLLPLTSEFSLLNSHLSLLLKENTFTVCTGHQLCLFTGPLYFIYKIISTINLAEALKKKHPETNFVPVYWMASEDHDFEEVNHVNIFGKRIEWTNRQGGAVGKYLNDGIDKIIEELKPILGDSQQAKELTGLFQNAYVKHATLSAATRFLVHELFGQFGLVIIDPNDARFKKEFTQVIADDLFNNTAHKVVAKSIADLEKSGHGSQVNPREINLFYITDNQRNRIIKENNKFNIADTGKSFTENELKEELKQHPERFSPNVVTRPLYQQKLLPNLAYVGGPGELAYWLEYRQLFDHYKIPFPVLMPRNFVMLMDAVSLEKIKKLGLSSEDVFLPIHEMTEKYVKSISGDKISFNEEKEKLEKLYNAVSGKVSLVDQSLVSATKSELQKNLKSLDELEKKLLRAFKQKNETAVSQLTRLREKFIPGGTLQERNDNFIPFYLKHGNAFIKELKNNLDPFDLRFIILSESE